MAQNKISVNAAMSNSSNEWDFSCLPDPRWSETEPISQVEEDTETIWDQYLAPLHNEFDYLFEHRTRREWDGRVPQRQEWAKKVRKRDGHKCQLCGGLGQVAHHVIPVKQDPDLALDLGNGQTLCNKCHLDVHRDRQRKAGGSGSPWLY